MSGNEEVVVDEVVVDETAQDNEADKGGDPVVSEVEQKAMKMGWTPLDKFKGDPDKWRPADEFVERGENMLPIIKAQVKRQDREIAELKETLQKFGEYTTKTEQRAYEKALNELREQRAQAIASGDGAAFDRVDGEINAMREQFKPQVAEVKQKDSETDPVYVEWKSRNSWVNDARAEKWAFDYGNYLINAGKADRGIDVFEQISKAARAEFPEKFSNPRRDAAPSVEGGVPAARRGGKSYAD
ncbi:MAG: hypothetical protein WCD86_11110, partial [Ktedonobacteraceae bacterium]